MVKPWQLFLLLRRKINNLGRKSEVGDGRATMWEKKN